MILIVVLLLAACGLGSAGVFVLWGLGWTLLFGAACCVGLSVVMVRGLS